MDRSRDFDSKHEAISNFLYSPTTPQHLTIWEDAKGQLSIKTKDSTTLYRLVGTDSGTFHWEDAI